MRKKRSTRRGRAGKSLCFLAFLLLLLVTIGGYGLTPAAALRQSEGTWGIGRTEKLWTRDISGWWRADRLILSANDRTVLFSVAHRSWQSGWESRDGLAVDRTGGGVCRGDIYSLPVGDGGAVRYLFGWVEGPSAARVEVDLCENPGEAEYLAHFVTEQKDWFWRERTAYFLVEIPPEDWPPVRISQIRITVLDGAGNQLECRYTDLDPWTHRF